MRPIICTQGDGKDEAVSVGAVATVGAAELVVAIAAAVIEATEWSSTRVPFIVLITPLGAYWLI